MDSEEFRNRFTYHPPKGDQPGKYEVIRSSARLFADMINDACPESREKALAFTKLEEAIMWANASIARHDGNE